MIFLLFGNNNNKAFDVVGLVFIFCVFCLCNDDRLNCFLKFNELGVAGGQQRRHGVFASHVQAHAGIQEPEIEVKISSTEKFERL